MPGEKLKQLHSDFEWLACTVNYSHRFVGDPVN